MSLVHGGRTDNQPFDKADDERVDAPRLLLLRIAAKVMASPLSPWFGMFLGVGNFVMQGPAKISADSTTLYITGCVLIATINPLAALPLFSLRRVTREEGQLKKLGVGSAKISAEAAKRLQRWHVGLFFMAASNSLVSLLVIVDISVRGTDYGNDTVMFGNITNAYVFSFSMLVWWMSLKQGAALVRDEVIQTRKLIDNTSATSAEWDALVVPQVLKLINVTLPELSRGWADGRLALWSMLWTNALAQFSGFVEKGSTGPIVSSVMLACIPQGLAADVAGATSDCDTIATSFNDKRTEFLLDVDTDAKLQILERAIDKQNRGAGIGFVVVGMVLDRRTLKKIFVAMSGFLATALPLILALQPERFVAGTTTCALSAGQVQGIQGVIASSCNATCNFDNVTIGSVLRLKHDDSSARLRPVAPLDKTLSTFPVAAYGALWGHRSDEAIANMSRMSMVVLMQEDGECWTRCRPHVTSSHGQCGAFHNASDVPGCDAACDQRGTQLEVFRRMKAAARYTGRRSPHCVLYINTDYLWPYDAASAAGDAVRIVDVHGKAHVETCDPGLFPSFLFDYSKKAAQEAWLSIVARGLNSSADGVYADCYINDRIICRPPGSANCTAFRKAHNGAPDSQHNVVSQATAEGWMPGKERTMRAAAEMVAARGGSFFAKNAPLGAPPPWGGNTNWIWLTAAQYYQDGSNEGKPMTTVRGCKAPGDVPGCKIMEPAFLIAQVKKVLQHYSHTVVGTDSTDPTDFMGPHGKFNNSRGFPNSTFASFCGETGVALFLLALPKEGGAYMLCQGWDEKFGRRLGRPVADAVKDATTGEWSRSFEHGTVARWRNNSGSVKWAPPAAAEQQAARNAMKHDDLLPPPTGACASVSDCYGLGDCVNGRCSCDSWARGAADCSVFAVLPVDWEPSPGYRNSSQPSWGGSFIPDPHGGPGHGFVAAMSPDHVFEPNNSDFKAPMVIHVRSRSRAAPLDGPFDAVAGGALNHSFQAQMRRLPASHGGGHVLFSNSGMGSGSNGLFAGHVTDLDRFGERDGAGGVYPRLQHVYNPPAVDPKHPWICHTNDWGAEVLPDGSVLALFRNGGHHCANNSYPGWPAEQLGLLRASCWNCSDYKVITPTPLFQGLPSGKSNEDVFLWWSHRGLHMVLHSQDPSDPEHAPHSTRGAVAFSPDTTTFAPDSWVLSPRPAYGNSILLNNGTTLTAKRRQRPQLSFDEHGSLSAVGPGGEWPRRTVTHLENVADLEYGQNSDGWGAGQALLLPLRQERIAMKHNDLLQRLYLAPCNSTDRFQRWRLPAAGQRGRVVNGGATASGCLSATAARDPAAVVPCSGPNATATWFYNSSNLTLSDKVSGLCLDVHGGEGPELDLWACHPASNADHTHQMLLYNTSTQQLITTAREGVFNAGGCNSQCVSIGAQDPATPTSGAAECSSTAALTLLPKGSPSEGPACLDGSEFGVYHVRSRSNSTRWTIYLQGGGWCADEVQCLGRANTSLGSTAKMPKTAPCRCMNTLTDRIDPDCNCLYLPYCDGASFSGYRPKPWPVPKNGGNLTFRGLANLDAAVAYGLQNGLKLVTDLVVTGGSAGGLSTYLHADRVAAQVRSAMPLQLARALKVTAASDVGYFADHGTWRNTSGVPNTPSFPQANFTTQMEYIVRMQNATAALKPACKMRHPTQPGLCFLAPRMAAYVTTPLFVFNSKFDQFQLGAILQVPPANWSGESPGGGREAVIKFGASFLRELAPVLKPQNGAFITTCICHGCSWYALTLENKTALEHYVDWSQGRTTGKDAKHLDPSLSPDGVGNAFKCSPWPTTQLKTDDELELYFYSEGNLNNASFLPVLLGWMDKAKACGYDAMFYADSGIQTMHLHGIAWSNATFRASLRAVQAHAKAIGLGLAPLVFPFGPSDPIFAQPPWGYKLAEPLAFRDALFEVDDTGRELKQVQPASWKGLANGDFQNWTDETFGDWEQDAPGVRTFVHWDAASKHKCHSEGGCLRIGRYIVPGHRPPPISGNGLAMQTLPGLPPFSQINISFWAMTDGFSAVQYNVELRQLLRGGANASIGERMGRRLSWWSLVVLPTQQWTRYAIIAPSWDGTAELGLFLGVEDRGTPQKGSIYFDDVSVSTTALVNVLRRDGSPLSARAVPGGAALVEGKDFENISDPLIFTQRRFDTVHVAPKVSVPTGSRLRRGQRLSIDYYAVAPVFGSGVASCLMHEGIFQYMEQSAAAVAASFSPSGADWKGLLLSYDEIRMAHNDEQETAAFDSAGELLAFHVENASRTAARAYADARLFAFGDEFNPYHNAGTTGNASDGYFLVNGSMHGSWATLKRSNVTIVTWGPCNESAAPTPGVPPCNFRSGLQFFSQLGVSQVLGGYYDYADPATGKKNGTAAALREWEFAKGVKGIQAFAYFTWQSNNANHQEDYDQMCAYGSTLRRLHTASLKADDDDVGQLLLNGEQLQEQQPPAVHSLPTDEADSEADPFINAARSGNLPEVLRLLRGGCDVNSRSTVGYTALTPAAFFRRKGRHRAHSTAGKAARPAGRHR